MSDPATRTGSQWATSSGDAWAELWEHTDRGLEGFSSHLLSAMLTSSPEGGFRAFDVGCGPGSTSAAGRQPGPGIEATVRVMRRVADRR